MSRDHSVEQDAARLLDARIGLKPDLSFRPRLTRALRDVAEAGNIDPQRLVGALAGDADLLDQLLDRITVQETAFFRHPEQFEAIVSALLPAIDGKLRAWSAACANGQEAYSLAMIAGESGRSGAVIATDVSPAALQRTADARYDEREMRGVSTARRHQHFVRTGDGWQATKNMRNRVDVRRHNLLDPIPAYVADCNVVMCRNVLIYLTRQHAQGFLDRLADAMNSDAYLFIGGGETVWHLTDRFDPVQIGACYAYRPRARSAAFSPPHASARPRVPIYVGGTPHASSARRPVSAPRTAVGRVDHADADHGRIGRQLLESGSTQEAIVAFRRWTYDAPDDPSAHLQLALALERGNDRATARRAYRAALAALDRCDPARLETLLAGYEHGELRRLLLDRCATVTP